MSTETITITKMPARESTGCPIHAFNDWKKAGSLPARLAILAFGLIAYGVFFGTICYAIGFVTELVVPKHINTGTPSSLLPALLINGAMLFAFVVQHTIMARQWFKRWVTRYIPESIERSLFVLLASAILAFTFWQWRPMPEVVWSIEQPMVAGLLTGISLLGWGIVFASSFMVSHFDLFGVRQVLAKAMGREYAPIPFRLIGLYKLVRHPLMLGFIIAVWSTSHMTVGHLFFAVMITAYIFFGTAVEERDLVREFGEEYTEYRRKVRGLLPLPRFSKEGA